MHLHNNKSPILRLISRLIWRRVVAHFQCYISPGAQIGPGLYLPHPVAIVIGEGVEIGENVTVYQGVTVGRKLSTDSCYPIVEDNVTIYSGATIIGPVRVGRGAVVGAHAVVCSDVPAYSIAVGAPARTQRND
jgi:serine O-acetyltransferase